jgi:hypothetical protein
MMHVGHVTDSRPQLDEWCCVSWMQHRSRSLSLALVVLLPRQQQTSTRKSLSDPPSTSCLLTSISAGSCTQLNDRRRKCCLATGRGRHCIAGSSERTYPIEPVAVCTLSCLSAPAAVVLQAHPLVSCLRWARQNGRSTTTPGPHMHTTPIAGSGKIAMGSPFASCSVPQSRTHMVVAVSCQRCHTLPIPRCRWCGAARWPAGNVRGFGADERANQLLSSHWRKAYPSRKRFTRISGIYF